MPAPDSESVLAVLEAVTAEMLDTPVAELERLSELAQQRGELAARLRTCGLEGDSARVRLERLVAAGDELEGRVRTLAAVLERELGDVERQDRFARELQATVPAAPSRLNLQA